MEVSLCLMIDSVPVQEPFSSERHFSWSNTTNPRVCIKDNKLYSCVFKTWNFINSFVCLFLKVSDHAVTRAEKAQMYSHPVCMCENE